MRVPSPAPTSISSFMRRRTRWGTCGSMRGYNSLVVVKATLCNIERARFDAAHRAMLPGYAPRPVSSPFVTQRLRLANAGERVFLNVSNQPVNSAQDATITLAPVLAVLLPLGCPIDLQSRRRGASAGQSPPQSRRAPRADVARWLASASDGLFPDASPRTGEVRPRQVRTSPDSTRRQSCSTCGPR